MFESSRVSLVIIDDDRVLMVVSIKPLNPVRGEIGTGIPFNSESSLSCAAVSV
jgi:hypothetical protein